MTDRNGALANLMKYAAFSFSCFFVSAKAPDKIFCVVVATILNNAVWELMLQFTK